MTTSLEAHITSLVESRTPPQTKILLMAVVGSRGKRLSSEDIDSDYDVKVVVLYPKKHYLLQKTSDTKNMVAHDASKYGNTDLEMTIISVLKFIQWCIESNQTAFDVLFTPIHMIKDDQKVHELKELFIKHFRFQYTMTSLAKQIRVEKDACEKKKGHLNLKVAMNIVYYKMRILHIESHQTVPPMDVEKLIKEQHVDDQSWISDLLKLRKIDKNKTFEHTSEFEKFIHNVPSEKMSKFQATKEAIDEGEDLFLKYCGFESHEQ